MFVQTVNVSLGLGVDAKSVDVLGLRVGFTWPRYVMEVASITQSLFSQHKDARVRVNQ